MKILIVRMWADCLNINSYNCQEIGLAKALIRNNNVCDIVLYTNKKENYEEDLFFDDSKKIHIYYLRAKSIFKNALFDAKLYEIIKKYDIVQTAEYDQIGNVKLLKKAKGKMIVYHGPYESNYTNGYHKKCIISDLYYKFHPEYKNTRIITKSKLATDLVLKKGFKNVSTIGVGIDVDRFRNTNKKNKVIEEIIKQKKEKNLKYLLYIGKIEDRRNILFLIDIIKNILKYNENIKLIMIGNGEKDYLEKCIEYAKKYDVLDNIIYYEKFVQDELTDLYKECDIFLLPTKYEIFGMVLLEAMYFGLPIITTLNGGSSTLIENQSSGIICNENDLEQWIFYINKLLNDNEYYKKISKNAEKQIKDNFTWDSLVKKILNNYEKVKI